MSAGCSTTHTNWGSRAGLLQIPHVSAVAQTEALFAQPHTVLEFQNAAGQLFDVDARRPQQVHRQSFGGLFANSRQLGDRLDGLADRGGIIDHVSPGMLKPPVSLAISAETISCDLVRASLTAAMIRS